MRGDNVSEAELFHKLARQLRERSSRAGVSLDTYDPDFMLGVIMNWLDENDAVLTATGIRR